ncbi:unnamed protein product, partial [Rotaria magnacalcarata]
MADEAKTQTGATG